jgi:MinD-like ATPase involved in chromosome partitioning or flagellar assembly/ActR/RegA family two-component response regulator
MDDLAKRTLLIENSESVVSQIESSLSDPASFAVLRSGDLTSGLSQLRSASFDAVVLDLTLPDSAGIGTLIAVRNECPEAPIVVLGDDENPGTGMRVLSEGAQDYVTKAAWNPASLPRILRFAIERHNTGRPSIPARNGRLLTFIGAKGGAGTTTVALNVAAALASLDHTTVATEWCWPRGNISLCFSEPPVTNLSAIGDLPPRAITKSVLKKLLVTSSNNLMLLHGPQTAAEFQYWNPAQAEAFVGSLLQIADFAVMDLPPHPSTVGRVAIHNSSTVVVVLERNPESVVLANETLCVVRSWATSDTAITAVVVSKGGSATPMSLDDIRSQLRCGVVGVVPPSTEPMPGFSKRLPITISRPGTLPADALTDIAKRLASKQLELLAT